MPAGRYVLSQHVCAWYQTQIACRGVTGLVDRHCGANKQHQQRQEAHCGGDCSCIA